LVQQEGLPVQVVPMPTVREPDGLAMSSRNVYLSPEERAAALALSHALSRARRMVMEDGVTTAAPVKEAAQRIIARQPLVRLEYISISGEETLEELRVIDRPALVLIAARIGTTRLIDNMVVVPKGMPAPNHLLELLETG